MNRLLVEAGVLLAVTVPPALPSFGCVDVGADLLGVMCNPQFSASRAGSLHLFGDRPDEAR